MTIYAAPSATVEAAVVTPTTGLVGTIGIRIIDTPSGSTFLARTTASIVENPAASGIYIWSGTGPTSAGTYSVIWDTGSGTWGQEDLVVTSSGIVAAAPTGSDLCTVADVKAIRELTTTASDSLIQTLITQASVAAMDRYQRQWGGPETATLHVFTIDPTLSPIRARGVIRGLHVDLAPFDLRSASLVAIGVDSSGAGGSALTADSQYMLATPRTRDGVYLSLQLSSTTNPWGSLSTMFGVARVAVTGNWGCAAVPLQIVRATAITVASWMDRAMTQYGLDLGGSDVGSPPTPANTWEIPMAAHRLFQASARMVVA